MKQFISALLLVTASVCSTSVSAQHFDSVLTVLDSQYPQEKIYAHFDRSAYSPGETIWFKTYLFAGIYPSGISKTVYAELIDDQGRVLQRKSAPVVSSSAAAAFDLPPDLKSPMVYVRAYTRWMLNFDTSFLFVKAIPITVKGKTTTTTAPAPSAYLQFFPEGGDLVNGIQSRVAFKATDNRGLPINVKGEVVSSSGKKIPFTSMHDGMGYFLLEPVAGEQYKATWKDPSGRPQETPLPASLATGMVLKVDNLGDKIDFVLQKSPESPYQAAIVVAQMHQQLLYRAKANLASRVSAAGTIPLGDLPAGIVQITVFTENEKPLAERIVFVNRDNYYFITDLNAASKGLTKRAKNVIQIDVPDTIACNLSIAITDASLNPPVKNEDDIFSHVLLSSDIKGYVHQPAYYFNGSDSATKHLDLVMLTNGWRRFKWEDALAGRFPTIKHQPENYMAIKGKVSGINKSMLANREIMALFETKNAGRNFLTIPVNPDGTFEIPEAIFFDTAKIYYQFNNDKDKMLTTRGVFEFRNSLLNEQLKLKPDASQPVFAARPDSIVAAKITSITNKRIEQEVEARRKVQTLATVEVKAKQRSKEEKINEQYTSGMFSGTGNVFVVEDDPIAQASMSVFHYLQGRVAGLRINMGFPPTLEWRGSAPSLFLDEMQTEADVLQNIPMQDVAMIKVFTPPFYGGFGGGGGGIAIYTKKGSSLAQNVKGLDVVNIQGYSAVKEFYSPDYSKAEAFANDQVDYRTTLFWSPFVLTDKQNRRILLTFYNNDITNRFRVVIEGCNADGKLTRMEKIFE